ncbi:coproporphyrinogen III oxidase [Calidifontibacter sp. DB0510]|uniref:Heme chaperone HemW n=1 Tax=Metallococcus carri TaxID=1656884 RepID=A0A967AWW5_9MICO|nr:radical SAM family heme chaperone HemW [Metallococcus carri]NHN54203.1 coproporphyrinogen III oxidase [Metallococcus carri]NOP36957.1 coproporphyrinogen III oxidase [Calidifontibacter sp. DB2511S]
MPSALPDGEPVPSDGALPVDALKALRDKPFGAYLHVPFCRVRCGYCDFNTYTLGELGPGAGITSYAATLEREVELAAQVLGEPPEIETVFVGGGTPTMLDAHDLVRMLDALRRTFGLADGAEVTTEANPDSVTTESLAVLRDGGFTRVSLGMQSAVPHVLKTLERTHDPANVGRVVQAARELNLQVSLDLIYGTPGESLQDWRRSLEAAIALAPGHISAYALVVEEGTKLAAQVRRGDVEMPDDDDEADKYELADSLLAQAGYRWYEISNWAAEPDLRCRHNDLYWSDANWWGFGPGAHSHIGGVRWWNVKHPRAYADRLAAGRSPGAGRELLTPAQRSDERVLLGIRRAEGLPIAVLAPGARSAIAGLIADGLIDGPAALREHRVVLTQRGRLLADTVVHRLIG